MPLSSSDPGRRVALLTRDIGAGLENWYIDLPETLNETDARDRLEQPLQQGIDAVVNQNGGSWSVVEFTDAFPVDAPHDPSPISEAVDES